MAHGFVPGAAAQQPETTAGGGHPLSDLLAPQQLGLVVLDEEHDRSYKQDSPMPCYHARDVAQLQAQSCGAIDPGQCTPSLETWRACQGPTRTASWCDYPSGLARVCPPVLVVDMRLELAEGHRRLVSRPLMDRLQTLKERGEQAVVLVPRQGYSSFLSCRSCGEVVQCPHCDVALTVHRQQERLASLPLVRPSRRNRTPLRACGSTAFKPFGAGTQQVLEHLSDELEDLRRCFDRDTTSGRDGHRQLLERFARGEADVLIGTQMLAKGMDLPRVPSRPCWRPTACCIARIEGRRGKSQLLLQLAGRAGRGDRPGKCSCRPTAPNTP